MGAEIRFRVPGEMLAEVDTRRAATSRADYCRGLLRAELEAQGERRRRRAPSRRPGQRPAPESARSSGEGEGEPHLPRAHRDDPEIRVRVGSELRRRLRQIALDREEPLSQVCLDLLARALESAVPPPRSRHPSALPSK